MLSMFLIQMSFGLDLLVSSFNYLTTTIVAAFEAHAVVECWFTSFRIEVIRLWTQFEVSPALVSPLF